MQLMLLMLKPFASRDQSDWRHEGKANEGKSERERERETIECTAVVHCTLYTVH